MMKRDSGRVPGNIVERCVTVQLQLLLPEFQRGLTTFFLHGVLRAKPPSDTLNQISAGTRTLLASSLEDTFEFPAGQRCCMSR